VDFTSVVLGGVAAVMVFLMAMYSVKRFFSKALTKKQMYLVEFLALLFSISLFLAVASPATQMHNLFFLVLAVFVIAMGVLMLGTWRVLEQYLTGLFVTRVLDLHVGDYVELDNMRGYITALEDTYVVVRDPRREYVYIPYTVLLRRPFRRVKAPEGHEVRVRLFVPRWQELRRVKDVVGQVAKEYGLERLSVDVEKIGVRGVVIVVRGVLKDPRQEDELKYAVLDRVYAEFQSTRRGTG
jgi:small-conductance mechanosensitive channel